MTDSLYELLAPNLSYPPSRSASIPSPTVVKYLSRLTTLPLASLDTTEPQSLAQAAHSNLLSLQSLSLRSHRSVITSSDELSSLRESLPEAITSVSSLQDGIPKLDEETVAFTTTYSKSNNENAVLDRRKKAMHLARNVDRLSDILELPTLLSTTISSASATATGGGIAAGGANYSAALDLFAHTKRLQMLYPDSDIVKSVLCEAEEAMKDMTTNLISSLRGQDIRLAAAIRTIGWLRRVAPELSSPGPNSSMSWQTPTKEGLFGALFLTARLANLLNMLEALSPLRDLADQESSRRMSQKSKALLPTTTTGPTRKQASAGTYTAGQGQQTERYLKRYIEIFREQSFATVSMYRSVFPPPETLELPSSLLLPLPSALATFPLHLVELLMSTLKTYLPNVTDPSARESLLMQVLYAAGSLGRLGADFGMMISLLEDEDEEEVDSEDEGGVGSTGDDDERKENIEGHDVPEWVRVMKKHRIQAGRLEALAAGQDSAALHRGSS